MTDELQDIDPVETREWIEAVEDVIDRDGSDRAHFLLDNAVRMARESGANLPFGATTAYQNTIPADRQPEQPRELAPLLRGRCQPHRRRRDGRVDERGLG